MKHLEGRAAIVRRRARDRSRDSARTGPSRCQSHDPGLGRGGKPRTMKLSLQTRWSKRLRTWAALPYLLTNPLLTMQT